MPETFPPRSNTPSGSRGLHQMGVVVRPPASLLQNEFIQRQIGNRLAQPAVLELKVLHSPPNSWRHRSYVTSLTPIWRIASTIFWPCETRTSTCRNFATISSGLYRFLAISQRHTSSRTTSMGVDQSF